MIAAESIEKEEGFIDIEEKLNLKGFELQDKTIVKSQYGYEFSYVYSNGEKQINVTGLSNDEGDIIELDYKSGFGIAYVIITITLLLIVITSYLFVKKVETKKDPKLEYYIYSWRRKGYTDKQIKQTLSRQGYSKKDIKKHLR